MHERLLFGMKALSPPEFSALMERLGPFEPAPRLAVAVSGGADSLAATLLAAHWAHERGGQVVALTVDHRLRPNSTAEAVLVGRWLANHGIEHHILPWLGDKPAADLQAQARAARYALLEQWCRATGIVHVVLAHHQDDQAETFLLRLARGSGLEGLSAMADIRHGPHLRWLRPLLGIAKGRLLVTLRDWDQDWVDDPSNSDPRHARVRLRLLAGTLAAEGLESARLAETAARLGLSRDALERDLADALVRWGRIHPAGFAWVDDQAWRILPEDLALRLLTRLLRSFGGEAMSPRLERSQGLLQRLRRGQGGTLAGCRVVPQGDGQILFCREAGRMAPPMAAPPGAAIHWDGRFRAVLPADLPAGLELGGLGPQGWGQVAKSLGRRALPAVPAVVRPTIPALFDQDGVFAAPYLGYNRGTESLLSAPWIWAAPRRPLTEIAHCLV
ncbi:tRNA lysidine(34) synthetase TilS [Magnetospirillum sulfuroxidans]|uniref:tRNA(Ile)-lysidine synthase n=1 Tax=Magnetospirillum sulfuroxidans TaxID=611300 RepID=A0ABS5I7J6_9PROT|nr:tRNA lysidine(34) synthetase TilS [Magnetospirillum sulfuroxidans]MBR9970401.1 tRNA lysidine(34) synthetase TilS [Magnetospirillum sulfuroxidans]